MTKALGMSSVLSGMSYDPIKQEQRRDAVNAGKRDNRAVSNESQILGEQAANETNRLMGLGRIGDKLASRKDDLAFARKTQEFRKESYMARVKRAEEERAIRQSQFDRKFALEHGDDDLEMGLGLLSLGTTIYGDIRSQRQQTELLSQLRQNSLATLGISYDYYYSGEEDEDPLPLDVTPLGMKPHWNPL